MMVEFVNMKEIKVWMKLQRKKERKKELNKWQGKEVV